MNIAFSDINDFVAFGNEEAEIFDEYGNKIKCKRNFIYFKNSRKVTSVDLIPLRDILIPISNFLR